MAAVAVDGKWGFVDKSGRIAIEPQFDAAERFGDGLAPVKIGGKWSFIDKTGKAAIEGRYDFTYGYSEGLAPVLLGRTWKYIDKTGKEGIATGYALAGRFREGLAAAALPDGRNPKRVYIDKTGRVVLSNLPFKTISEFSDGVAMVEY
jgi:hypothetical protein